ncbi:MAG: AEC family transporter [Eubacteriales bacterium]|nr:AEC family transporter [Eubacteriales bacterium]
MDLLLPIRTVLPLVMLVCLGILLKKVNLLNEKTRLSMNKIVYNVFLPSMLFYNIYKSDIKAVFNASVVRYTLLFSLSTFVVLVLLVPLFVKDRTKSSVLIQAVQRSNNILLGIPIVAGLYGNENIGLISLLVAIIVPIETILCVVLFELFRNKMPKIKDIILGIIKNPLVIASAAGILSKLTGITLPYVIDKFVFDLAKIATPLAIIILGAFLNFKVVTKQYKHIIAGVAGRLIVVPAIEVTGAILLGFRGVELLSIVGVSSMSTGVSTLPLAEQMGGDADLAAHLIIFGTAALPVTILALLYILQGFGFI